MRLDALAQPVDVKPLDLKTIRLRLEACPRLPSLRSIDTALRELLNADHRYTQQIAEVIRRDPSLTARLLRLVNSVYYGLSTPVQGLEEAVLYLGLRQIRQLVMVTPILEDFQKLTGNVGFSWREFWRHCIGTAMLTREVMTFLNAPMDETDYVAGLTHDVGKIVMAHAFPEHFLAIYHQEDPLTEPLLMREEKILGVNHALLGSMYLENYRLPRALIDTARHHHNPLACSPESAPIVAAVQIADLLMHQARIGDSGNTFPVTEAAWREASGWEVLFPQSGPERNLAQAGMKRGLDKLSALLEGMV